MAGTNESTEAKSKAVTSRTTASRQLSNVSQNTSDGVKLPTEARDAEKMREMLARIIDVTHNWPCKSESGKMPKPFISRGHVVIAFPLGGHVLQNTVTSDGKQNFDVDGVPVKADK